MGRGGEVRSKPVWHGNGTERLVRASHRRDRANKTHYISNIDLINSL
jgi:hypothetical protein